MRRLNETELARLIEELEQDYAGGPPGRPPARWQVPARLEFPLGELFNPRLAGYLLAWRLTGRLRTARIGPADRFDAQGLEGKCRVEPLSLSTALLAARELPPFRRAVFIQTKAKKGAPNERHQLRQ